MTTGARTVSFLFDLIHVRNDGDPAGAGEFTFTFGVGDVITSQLLGPVESFEDDIPAGYGRDVNKENGTFWGRPRRERPEIQCLDQAGPARATGERSRLPNLSAFLAGAGRSVAWGMGS